VIKNICDIYKKHFKIKEQFVNNSETTNDTFVPSTKESSNETTREDEEAASSNTESSELETPISPTREQTRERQDTRKDIDAFIRVVDRSNPVISTPNRLTIVRTIEKKRNLKKCKKCGQYGHNKQTCERRAQLIEQQLGKTHEQFVKQDPSLTVDFTKPYPPPLENNIS
jgi:hypothetical protein